jgi:thiamine monophosphate kinase
MLAGSRHFHISRISAPTADRPALRLAGVGDDYELVFTSPTDASPAIECLSPELALPITATCSIERKAGVRLADAARKQVPITASGWQHF